MKTGQILALIEEEFHRRLEQKTNWGRVEVKKLYMESVNKVLSDLIDKPNANGNEQQEKNNPAGS